MVYLVVVVLTVGVLIVSGGDCSGINCFWC